MQANTIHTAQKTSNQFLDTLIAEKNNLAFAYIGKNSKLAGFFEDYFHAGIAAESYSEIKTALTTALETGMRPDVIIIDTPFQENDLTDLHSFLKSSELSTVPVLFNEQKIMNKSVALKYPELIDDVVDLGNSQLNFASKIRFLKKVKEEAASFGSQKEPIALNIRHKSNWAKRSFDILVSSLLLILLSPVLLLIAIIVKLESKGPIFYNAKRAGRGFKIFSFHKFRTMEVNADKKIEALAHLNQYASSGTGPKFFKIANDPRITRFGKFLRNTSLDELPQLYNVLKGEMSLVGNRPLPLYEAATLTTNEFVERFMAPAGITGLWQIKKRGRSTEMSVEERISLDISYARRSSLLYDFWIMANTPKALIQKTNV